MKRVLEEDSDRVRMGKKSRVWSHDRQPDWEDLQRMEEAAGKECEEEVEDDDEIILRSRRRQHRLDTQRDSDGNDMEVPGAPVKGGRRTLPWTEQGRLLWPRGEDEAVVQVEDSQAGGSGDDDSQTLEGVSVGCSSFVVDDDSESVVEEEKEPERRLRRAALEDVRSLLRERIERWKARLEVVEEQLASMATPGGVTSLESELEAMDERMGITRYGVERQLAYPWEDKLASLFFGAEKEERGAY